MLTHVSKYIAHLSRRKSIQKNSFLHIAAVILPLVGCGSSSDPAPETEIIARPGTAIPSVTPSPAPSSKPSPVVTPQPDRQTTVYFLSSKIASTTTKPSNCNALTQKLATTNPVTETLGPSFSDAVRDFSAQWLAGNGQFVDDNGLTIITKPTKLYTNTLFSITLDAIEWSNKPSIEAHDVGNAVLVEECVAIAELEYQSTGLVVSTDESVVNWVSEKAVENMENYNLEVLQFVKDIYGRKGLGFGEYTKAGVFFEHVYSLPGPFSHRLRSTFSLFWSLHEESGKNVAVSLIPPDIDKKEISNWTTNCQTIKMRVASEESFHDGSIWVINRQADCLEKPIFRSTELPSIPDNSSAEFLEFLSKSSRLHHITFPLDDLGLPIECREFDKVTFDGCSLPIVGSFNGYLTEFFANRSDLYIEINFSDVIVKKFRANTLSGEVEDIGTQILQ